MEQEIINKLGDKKDWRKNRVIIRRNRYETKNRLLKWSLRIAIGMYIVFSLFICAISAHADQCLNLRHSKILHYTASWYGTTGDHTDPWKHTTTASGEKFNENALIAASWKFPLGSLVKVINLRNHHSVLVRINDRGPGRHLYRKGRIIDLTRGAFARIANLRDGVIPVATVWIK